MTDSLSVSPAPIEGLQSWQLDTIAEIKRRDEVAEEAQWTNAEDMHRLNESGMTQQDIADAIGRSQPHVSYCVKVWTVFHNLSYKDRPTFNEAYNSDEVRGKKKAHVSQNSGENEWYTPVEIIDAARQVMGGIDLDPASTAAANRIVSAAQFYTQDDDGLAQEWFGRVWMNPPYAQPWIERFALRLIDQYKRDNVSEACVLVNNASDTKWFTRLSMVANARCDVVRRVRFWHPDRDTASPLQGQTVWYFGANTLKFKEEFSTIGVSSSWAGEYKGE